MRHSDPRAPRRHRSRAIVATAGVLALPAALAVGLPSASAAPVSRTSVQGAPSWTAASAALATAPSAQQLDFTVTLTPRDAAGAQRFADAVSDPKSSSFRKFLTPQQFTDRFNASPADVASVVGWLRAAGLHTGTIPLSRNYIPVSGTVATVDRAFSSTISRYQRNGHLVTAPSRQLTVPAAVAGKVGAVLGLDTSEVYRSNAVATPLGASAGNTSCSTYWGENTNTSYAAAPTPLSGNLPNRACYTPSRLDAARGIPATGKTGAGVTVGIVLWCDSHTIPTDVNTWAAQVGAPALTAGQFTANDPSSWDSYCTNQANIDNSMVETALDVESIHGAAPNANIVYSPAAGPYNSYLTTATQSLVNANQVSVITNSWGGGESTAFLHSIYVQAASQGISVLASSGDAGDNDYANGSSSKGSPSADYPASDSELTSIGGTSLGITSGNTALFEQPWYDVISRRSGSTWGAKAFYGASGGGKSGITAQPSYQAGIVPSSFAGSGSPRRTYPDIANIADSQTGYVVGVSQSGTYTTFTVGGTSLASPYTAGEVALAIQTKGARLGFLNPKLYTNRATAVTDLSGSTVSQGTEGKWTNPSTGAVTEPTTYFLNGQGLLASSQKSVAGWDNITGLGAVSNASAFISAIQ